MRFEVTILGNNSAFPAHGRFPTSQVVNHNDQLFMVDCGEGAQMRCATFRVKRSRIDHIFISHLHGDHVYGLPGFINSMAHGGRARPLHIYGPKGIRQLVDTVLRLSVSMIDYEIRFHELDSRTQTVVFRSDVLRISAFPLKHRIPTYGYLFTERERQPNIRKDAIEKYNLSVNEIRRIKAGGAYRSPDGTEVSTNQLTYRPRPRSYAYCSDTTFDKEIVPIIRGVDLLYHEATFLHELESKAEESKHSTAFQAGMIAHLADAGRLIIGHFSSRYVDLAPLKDEAAEIFRDVEIADEGRTFEVGRE